VTLAKLGRPAEALVQHGWRRSCRRNIPKVFIALAGTCGEMGLAAEATEAHRRLAAAVPASPSAGAPRWASDQRNKSAETLK
jgi:hypothetical protein